MTGFQRARQPEQKHERRQVILAAAAALFDEEGPNGTGLNAIAARAGFTKSNLYRYFESREEVLLSLFLDDFERFTVGLETSLSAVPQGDIATVAKTCTSAFLAQPRLCTLISMLSSVLEQNVSEAVIINLKRALFTLSARIAAALHRALPAISIEDCGWIGNMAGTLVAGLWPSALPNTAASRVLAMPEFAGLKPVVGRDIERAIFMLVKGLMA